MLTLFCLWGAYAAEPIVVWHAMGGTEEQALLSTVEEWSQHSGREVQVVAIPAGAFDSKFETAVPRGNGPDLAITAHVKREVWREMTLLEPLELPDRPWWPAAREAVVDRDGRAWAIPLSLKCPVLMYDPTKIDHPPATTDELLALAREWADHGDYGLAYEAAVPYFHAAWMHGFGGQLFDAQGEATLDTPEQVAAFGFVHQLSADGLIPGSVTSERLGQLYDEGRVPLVINGPWFVPDRKRKIAFAPMPVVSSTGLPARPYLTVDVAFVAQGADPDAALLAAWLGSEFAEVQRRDIAGQVAASQELLYTDPLQRVIALQAETAVPMPVNARVLSAFEAQARALRRVVRGSASPEQAAEEAQYWYASLTQPPAAPAAAWPYVLGLCAILGLLSWRAREHAGLVKSVYQFRYTYLWVFPAVFAVVVLVVLPFIAGTTVSLLSGNGGDWTFVGMRNFVSIVLSKDWPLTSPMSFYYTLLVTLLWTSTNVVLHVAIGLGFALVLREPWVKLKGLWRSLLILPWAVPNYITALIWRSMFDAQYGAINALLGAVIGHPVHMDWFASFGTAFSANLITNTWLGFPFMMVVTLGALQAIPRELEEAAEVDGAGLWLRFRHVTWPLVKPALLPAMVLGSVWTFNMFNVVYLVSQGEPDGSTEILISQAYRWAFSRGHQYGYAAAYAVLIFGVLWLYSYGTKRWAR